MFPLTPRFPSSLISNRWQAGTALTLVLGLTTATIAPFVVPAPAFAQGRFTDVPSGYWAETFITELATRGVIAGFPDGSFHPNDPVTRAQYAAMVRNAFNKAKIRNEVTFVDVPGNHWARTAIDQAYTTGFLAGYPGNIFSPNQNIPRAQVLVSLANGLNYTPTNVSVVQVYSDASAIPNYAVSSIAAATENRMVVNYPNVQFLNPNQTATRADVAAFIYQALASQGQVATIASPYLVSVTSTPTPPPSQPSLVAGTAIPVAYTGAEKVVILPSETVPLTLTIPQNLVSSTGQVVVPNGSQVVGELRPAEGGTQFVAQEVVLPNGQRFPLNATSRTITETETIRKGVNTTTILAGAVLGAGAATAIEGLTGNRTIDAIEVLAGSAVGAAAGAIAGTFLGGESVEVINIDPDTDLTLTLNTGLLLPAQ